MRSPNPRLLVATLLLASTALFSCKDSKADMEPQAASPPATAEPTAKSANEPTVKPTASAEPAARANSAASAKPAVTATLAATDNGVKVSDHTAAPLRYALNVRLDARPDAVWALLSDHEALPTFFAPVTKVTVDNTGASTPNGVGAVRSCNLMGSELTENILIFEPNKALGYSVVKGGLPGVTDHLGLVRLQADGDGTIVRWEQYFNHPDPKPVVGEIGKLMAIAGDGLIKKFGGKVQA